MKIIISPKIINLLKKEMSFADFALKSLRKEMIVFEKTYSMDWHKFLSKFEKGELGDDRVWFKWYSLAQFVLDWHDTKKEIKKALRTS